MPLSKQKPKFLFFNFFSFIKKYLGSPADIDVEKLKVEYDNLKEQNIKLQKQVEELKKELETVRPGDDAL